MRTDNEATRTEKLLDISTIQSMNKMSEIKGAEKVQRRYVDYLWAKTEFVESEPDWKNCFNISMVDDKYLNRSLESVLNNIAGKLAYDGSVAIDMVKMRRKVADDMTAFAIFVKLAE